MTPCPGVVSVLCFGSWYLLILLCSGLRFQVCTKYCLFSGRDMSGLSKASVKAAMDLSRQRLGVDKIDLMQLYWGEYSYPK